MTYLGNAPNAGGFMFMKAPNNVIFYTTHCIFDESMFPRCNKVVKKPLTRLLEVPPTHHHHQDTIPVDEDDTPPRHHRNIPRNTREQPPQEGIVEECSPVGTPEPEKQQSPPRQENPPPEEELLQRSTRQTRVSKKPGNIYGDRHPVEILMDPSGKKGRKHMTRQQRETVLGPSEIPDTQQIPPKELGPEIPSVSPTPSEIEIEKGLNFLNKQADRVCQEGGVEFLNFLINKVISPNAELTTAPKEWSLKDIACLPELEQKEWKDACLQELEALKRHDVTPHPQG
jgi:hypothetical protein